MRSSLTYFTIVLIVGCALSACGAASLEDDFRSPPRPATPWVFWVWLRTPTNPAAMTRDLEEMKAKGITGFILYDAGAGKQEKNTSKMVLDGNAYKVVPTNEYKGSYQDQLPLLETWSPKWREEIRFVASEAKRLGLDFCLSHGLAGCSAPGLDPQYAQQMLDWTRQDVIGPSHVDLTLKLPKAKGGLLDRTGAPIHREVALLALPIKVPVSVSEVQDLSSRMDSSGHLTWDAPPGRWRILRFIQRPTGASNVWGLFCDTLSTAGIDQDWALTMAPLLKEMTPDERAALKGVEDDSWESGSPNWTSKFPAEFQGRRGYDLIPYLPCLAGETLVDVQTTRRVQQDFRQTISDLVVNNYYAHMESICRDNGLTLYDEANGPHLHDADVTMTASKVDEAMAEFWMPSAHRPRLVDRFLTRDAVTSNHLFGNRITMCEAFTSLGPMWEESPFSMKLCADQAFCDGTNRLCFHNFSHSPLPDAKPGDAYFAGTHVGRNITWWEQFPAFGSYVARCSAMLQDGSFVADALFETGDGIDHLQPTKTPSPQLGPGYDYDRASDDALIALASVKDGLITVPCGMSYRVLILPSNEQMRPDALKKIASLAEAGATIVGPRPTGCAGRLPHADDQKQFDDLLNRLWPAGTGESNIGQGRVLSTKTAEAVLRDEGVGPDFEEKTASASAPVAWIHRASADADWYYVASQSFSPQTISCGFRITGKQPELWDSVTGTIRDATAFVQHDGQTILPLQFDPCGSIFVVFRHSIARSVVGTTQSNCAVFKAWTQIAGSWKVTFDPKWGGPTAPVTFDRLADWTTRPETGIKYFSGTALYTTTFDLPSPPPSGQAVWLDLGTVHEVATVRLNGKDLGVLWMHPQRVDVTAALKPSMNLLEIKIVNLWPNRLIGDSFLPPSQQITKTNVHRFTQSSELLPSGLIGPVQLFLSGPPL